MHLNIFYAYFIRTCTWHVLAATISNRSGSAAQRTFIIFKFNFFMFKNLFVLIYGTEKLKTGLISKVRDKSLSKLYNINNKKREHK